MNAYSPDTQTLLHPVLGYARVLRGDGKFFDVEAEEDELRAERAASCLLDPAVGDLVLLSRDALCDAFILAVLRRKEGVPAGLTFEADVRIHSRGGGVALIASTDIALAAGNAIEAVAERVAVHSSAHLVEANTMDIRAGRLFAQAKRFKFVADSVEHIFRRFTERLVDAWRFVSRHEEVQTHSSRRLTAETQVEHAKNIVQTAEDTISCNANRINLC